jgi:putative Holliday junction resolvase
MRYLGIDYGAKHIGIAVSDQSNSFAFPRDTIPNDHKALEIIARIVSLEEIAEIIFGDTRSIDGGANQITAEADAFVEKLKQAAGVPTKRSREAWSSQEAARYAPPGQKHNDASAAAIILQRFLDARIKPE